MLLHIIEAFVIGLPDIDLHTFERIAVDIQDSATHDHVLAFAVETDVGSHFIFRRAADMERAEHRVLGRAGRTP